MKSTTLTFEYRFWLRVWPRGDCWEWRGSRDRFGYGMLRISANETGRAYRTAYELAKGTVPQHLEIDHLCRHHWCVKPSHLEAVAHKENWRRGNAPSSPSAASGLCKWGHPLVNGKHRRHCRTCIRLRGQRRRNEVRLRETLAQVAPALDNESGQEL